MSEIVLMKQGAPANPSTGRKTVYVNTAGKLVLRDEAGAEQVLSTEAGLQSVLDAAVQRTNHTGPLNWSWSTYGGTGNAVTLTPAYARAAYAVGDEFRFRATATNTGATTINVSDLGVKNAVTVTGVALPADYIRTDVDTVCVYDGTNFVVQREVEVGSNANGRFARLADGRQECMRTFDVAAADVAADGEYMVSLGWAYPVLFAAAPLIVADPTGAASGSFVTRFVEITSTNSGSVYLINLANLTRPAPPATFLIAHGYWY